MPYIVPLARRAAPLPTRALAARSFFYILFSSVAMAVAVVAITQIGTFSDGLSSLVCDTEQIRVQTATFVDNIAAPLQWIRGNVTTVVVGVEKDLAEIDKDRLFEKVQKEWRI